MGKIIFIDVDGTLVDYSGRLPASAVRAIREARANGHQVYISTGRSKAEVYQNIWDIGLDGMIGGNGSYVEAHGTVVLHQLITAEQCRHIVDWLHARKLEFYLESNSGLYASEHFETAGEPVIQQYSARKGKSNAQEMTVRKAFPDMLFGGDLYRDDLNKVSYILSSYQDFLDAQKEFPDLQNGTWGGAGETALFGDLGVKNITKANAIQQLLTCLGAKREDTIAIGDAKIDIPMFECCAVSVCMGSGGEEARKAADFVTDDVEKDGLYKAFVHLGLIGGTNISEQYRRMVAGLVYDPGDDAIMTEQAGCLQGMYDYNATTVEQISQRSDMLKEILGACGEGCYFEPPFRANWGGKHLFLGERVYANANLTLVDDGNIYIGNAVMLGPNVTIATAGHPINPAYRAKGLQFNADIHIGDNVWVGAGVTICPGVTIGENSVIGAGSVVTKDIPANVVAMGVPCRVVREITEKDDETWFRGRRLDV